MSQEKKLILEMLKEGKISVDEAERLLDAQSDEFVDEKQQFAKPANKKFFRVLVREADHTKVNINLPLALAEVGLKLVPKDKLKIEGQNIDLNEILRLIKEGSEGDLVNVQTLEDGKEVSVKVYVD